MWLLVNADEASTSAGGRGDGGRITSEDTPAPLTLPATAAAEAAVAAELDLLAALDARPPLLDLEEVR